MDRVRPDVAVDGEAPEVPSFGGDLPYVSVPNISGDVSVPAISGDASGAMPSVDAAVPSVDAAGESRRRASERASGCRQANSLL